MAMDETFDVRVPSPMRRTIATRMTEASRTIPHFRLTAGFEVDALLELCRSVRSGHSASVPSFNDLLIKACAAALMETPAINIQWVEGQIRQFSSADISVVVALDEGLATPIIRRAESKSIWEISREVKELAARAARNSLRMHEIMGGSFSISNFGMYDIDQFDAIINPPQCAILAVARAKPSLVVGPERHPRVATLMRVTLSMDHRAMDGVTGAKFLTALRNRIEQPTWMIQSETNSHAASAAPSVGHS